MTRATDVIVLGGGLAGCRAALEAAAQGARVALLAPAMPGRTGNSSRASGGFATALPPNDDWTAHFDDFLRGGYGINDRSLVTAITRQASDALHELARMADGFEASDGGFDLKQVPAHDRPRSAQFALGMERLMSTLGARLADSGVELVTDFAPVALLQRDDGRVCGVATLDAGDARVDLEAGAVVLATGGCGDLFPVTSNAPGVAGEGYAMALRAGCRLRDMEFIQFTPTAFAAPAAIRGQTIVGSLLSLPGVRLLNGRGERFMHDYDPERLERADRASLARAIFREIQAGRGSDAGGVFLDISAIAPGELNHHRPGFSEWLRQHGIDPARDPLQTAPSAHSCLGGVAVDDDLCAIAGLYVAGEALGGTHGANRLSSNSLAEANVTGVIAGRNAARCAQGAASPPSDVCAMRQIRVSGSNAGAITAKLKPLMGEAAGVERDAASIDAGLDRIAELAQCIAGESATRIASVAANRVLCCQAILTAARRRAESRGCHNRSDFPHRNDRDWFGNIYLTLAGDRLEASYQAI